MDTCTKMETVYEVDRYEGKPWVAGTMWMHFTSEERDFWLLQDDWRDMGQPETITVTIQPGDRLNNEPKSDHPELF